MVRVSLLATLPSSLRDRVRERPLLVSIDLELKRGTTTADSEHVVARVVASDSEGERVEVFGKDGWEVEQAVNRRDSSQIIFHGGYSNLFEVVNFAEYAVSERHSVR